MAEKIPKTGKTLHYFLASHNEKMHFVELEFGESEKAFKSLKQNKADGFDELSSNIIIDEYNSLENMLFYVYKAYIRQEIFPDSLKIARVTLIFKLNEKDIVSNY